MGLSAEWARYHGHRPPLREVLQGLVGRAEAVRENMLPGDRQLCWSERRIVGRMSGTGSVRQTDR